jgi:predicted DCC family thiol-disulfide oxidoreductase YuxK
VPNDGNILLIYDGDCGFCSASAAWIQAKWRPGGAAKTVPWQRLGEAGLERLGLTARDTGRAAWWVEDGQKSDGHLAVGHALAAAGGAWGFVGKTLLVPPVRWLAAAGYPVVARYRYRLPGGTSACKT